MTYREYIEGLRSRWTGKKVIYDGEVHTVTGVDYNGGLLIDKPARFTDSTAVPVSMIREI